MSKRIGVHLRVTGDNNQGGRKYMEDCFSVAYQHTEDQSDLEYAYFGIFDGHGGSEAALFAKHNLMDYIVAEKGFWSAVDDDVLNAIREGFIKTHKNMWRIQEEWPKTASGLPSTAGTTASIAFVRHGKIYTGHVGDSGIILGYQSEENSSWLAMPLTEDHKPESAAEKARIESNGGKVVIKSGVPRVVWNKPRIAEGHKGPIRRNTPVDEIPFLAVARSLGDLWSYNPENNVFVVSPEPDVAVRKIDVNKFRCLIFGTDGLWNMVTAQQAVTMVEHAEMHNKSNINLDDKNKNGWINPSKRLVEEALSRWSNTRMHADNITVVALMLDPPGTPKRRIVRKILDPQSAQHCSQDTIPCNSFCSNESVSSLPAVTPSPPKTSLQSIIKPTVNQEKAKMEESFANSLDCSNNPANFSTPYDSMSDMEETRNPSESVYTNLENMNDKVYAKCADEEEPAEDYSTHLMDFNKEYITNVIFGPLPNDTIYPEPTFTNLSGYENKVNSAKLVTIPEKKQQKTSNSENAESSANSINDDNRNVTALNLNDISIPKINQKERSLIEDNISTKSTTNLHESIEKEELNKSENTQVDCNVDSITFNTEKSESIQIHEISSSCAAQDVKRKVKGPKLQKPRKSKSKHFCDQDTINEKKPRISPEVSKRKSGRIFALNKTETEIRKYCGLSVARKALTDKHLMISEYPHALDPKLSDTRFPIVVLEDCSSDIKKYCKETSKVENKPEFMDKLNPTHMFSDIYVETKSIEKIKHSHVTKLVSDTMTHCSKEKVTQGGKRNTRSKTKISH